MKNKAYKWSLTNSSSWSVPGIGIRHSRKTSWMHLSRFSAYGIDDIQNGSYFQYHQNKQFRGSTQQNTTGRPTHTSVIKLYGIESYILHRSKIRQWNVQENLPRPNQCPFS